MTEKRFTLEEFGLNFIVNDNGRNLTAKQTVDRLNELNDENEQLKQVLGSILIEVRRDISATNHCGEVKAFVNPNSFDLISDVLKKYGALKDWYETKIQFCKNCKHLGLDGMFGLICEVSGNNKNYDCPKYEENGDVE